MVMSVGFIKIKIFFNLFILILLSSIILIEFLLKIQKKKEFQSKIEIKKFLFSYCKNKIGTNKWLIFTILFATILSIFRAIFVDPPIVVTDGYHLYAEQIEILLVDFNYDIAAVGGTITWNTAMTIGVDGVLTVGGVTHRKIYVEDDSPGPTSPVAGDIWIDTT